MEEFGFVNISEPIKDTREFGRSKGDVIEVTLTPKNEDYVV